jgi:hypothetical protein
MMPEALSKTLPVTRIGVYGTSSTWYDFTHRFTHRSCPLWCDDDDDDGLACLTACAWQMIRFHANVVAHTNSDWHACQVATTTCVGGAGMIVATGCRPRMHTSSSSVCAETLEIFAACLQSAGIVKAHLYRT